ncbi:MAG: hypothetical protein QNL99_09360 [SAR86 cluster bacterium]
MYRRKLRTIFLVLMPIFISGLASVLFSYNHVNVELNQKGQHFGNAIAEQLSLSVTDYLVNEDILSLNVVLNDLVAQDNFDFASIYSADNRLLAQAGKRSSGADKTHIFTRDITWQKASIGHLQISLDSQAVREPVLSILWLIVSIHLLIGAMTGFIVWQYADLLYLWIALPGVPAAPAPETSRHQAESLAAAEADPSANRPVIEAKAADTVIMVFKLRPARLLPDFLPRIQRALLLYSGDMTRPDGETILVYFTGADPIFRAICSGLLLLEIFHLTDTPISIKLGLQVATGSATDPLSGVAIDPQALANARKHASYLAANAENCLLTSQQVLEQMVNPSRFVITPFHSSLTPAGLVFKVEALALPHQGLIQSQARQLLQQ